jgi:hypothetical protein
MIYQILETFLFITALLYVALMGKLILDVRSMVTLISRQQQTLIKIFLSALLAESKETVYKSSQDKKG